MIVIQLIGMGAKKYGGLERYMLELAIQLERQGDKLIIVFETAPLATEYIEKLSQTNAEWFVISLKENKLKYIKELARLFAKYKPSIIQTNFGSSLNTIIPKSVGYFYGIKVLFGTEHCHVMVNTFRRKIIFRILVLFVRKLFCVSETSCQEIKKGLKFGAKNVETLYLGVNDFSYDKISSRIKYGLPQDETLIANVAYHNPVKGVDVLLEAVRLLKYEYKIENFKVCQIGGGQTGIDTTELYQSCKEKNITDCIIWLGIQNNVPEILSGCDIYCQPSRSEGIPLSIMEASLAKLPVVATQAGGIPEAAFEGINAFLVKSEDSHALAEKLSILIQNQSLRVNMGEKGRRVALDNFLITHQVEKLIQQYKQSLA